jgi:hypothetical protein
VAALFGAHAAFAEIDICQSDPIITMTDVNGSISRMSVESAVRTNPGNVDLVSYEVHVPSTVTAWSVELEGDLGPAQEQVTVATDAPRGQYVSIVSVSSSTHAALTATARMESGSTTRSGTVDHPIRLHLVKH